MMNLATYLENPQNKRKLQDRALNTQFQNISILTPTWNRNKFLKLYAFNLKMTNYPKEHLEVVIDDDGSEPFIPDVKEFEEYTGIRCKYLRYTKKRSIGEKRNNLVKNATHKIVCFMDDDDIYTEEYIRYSYGELKKIKGQSKIVGSNQMVFVYPEHNWKMTYINCSKKFQMHEATMMMTKKYWKSMRGFKDSSKGEGADLIQLQDKNVGMTECIRCMCCLAHDANTISKDMFLDAHQIGEGDTFKGEQRKIIKEILNIK